MKSTKQCFGCHGLFDVDDDIASSRRTSLHTLARDHEMDKSDIPTIRAFYDLNKKCYDTPLCWDEILSVDTTYPKITIHQTQNPVPDTTI